MNDHKDVPQGLKPSSCWYGAARLKPCPSWREFFPASMGLGKHEWKPQIPPPRYALSKNISKRGPRNCRSLHGTPHGSPGQAGQVGFAPKDTGSADDRLSAAPTALGSSSRSISQPSRAGLTFGGRPSGPCIRGDLCRVISPSTCRKQVSCSGRLHGKWLGLRTQVMMR
jgi:hypothetical protein